MANKKVAILLKYAEICKKLNRYPTMSEFTDQSAYTKAMIKHHMGSLSRLKDQAKEKYPEHFISLLDESLFTPKHLESLKSLLKSHRRFVITTAVTGCSADRAFLKSIESYNQLNKAKLLVLIASDPSAKHRPNLIDPAIPKNSVVISDISFNSNLHINTIKLSAKHIDPITGLARLGQRNGSFIYASPKQRLKYIATGNRRYTRCVMTTGAITQPQYDTSSYMNNRTAHIAEHDHIMGAVIVEIENDQKYHFRQIQADRDGSFIDLGKKYSGDQVLDCPPEAFILGDLHITDTDPAVLKCWEDVCRQLKPRQVILHDIFNGKSINHHEEYNQILRAQRAERGELSLKHEMEEVVEALNRWTHFVEKVIVVKSNHDEFLERYLREGKYIFDAMNHRFSLDLAAAMMDGNDPLKHAMDMLKLKHPEQFTWLKRDDDYIVARINIGNHGDKGANGARGSIKSIENAYGLSVTGHSHSPEILRGSWVVGTSSHLRLDYVSGPSSWQHTSCLLYPNGSRQLINVIEGKWRLPK